MTGQKENATRKTTSKRRIPIPKYKPGILYATWGRVERGEPPDVCAVGQKNDAGMLMTKFSFEKGFSGRTLMEELEERGYDLTTLRVSIKKKVQNV